MGYSNFKKIKTVVKKFNLDVQIVNLFPEVEKVEPSAWLVETLRRSNVMVLTNEKTKSERVISPILVEIAQSYTAHISFFLGEPLNVRPEDDLSGECDFFFALHPPKSYFDAPIFF